MNGYNSSSLKPWHFSGRDIILDYEFLILILNAFTVGTIEYYPKCYCENEAKGLQFLFQGCTFTLRGYKS